MENDVPNVMWKEKFLFFFSLQNDTFFGNAWISSNDAHTNVPEFPFYSHKDICGKQFSINGKSSANIKGVSIWSTSCTQSNNDHSETDLRK